MKSTEEWQADFYKSQPVGYRLQWWKWALTQPNFMQIYKLCVEKDERVGAIRQMAYEHFNEGCK